MHKCNVIYLLCPNQTIADIASYMQSDTQKSTDRHKRREQTTHTHGRIRNRHAHACQY